MATIINDTRPTTTEDSSVGMIVGLIVALVLIVLFVMYVIPSFRGVNAPADTTPGTSANINLTVPSGNAGGSAGGTGGTNQ